MHKCKLQALQRALRGRIPVTLLQPVAAVSIMPRSYIDNFSYFLGAYSGLLIGFSRESWFFLTSLTSINGWKSLYVGTSPNCAKKVDHGEPKAVKTSSVSVAGPAGISSFLGTRPPELVTPPRRAPVYSSSPKFGNSPEEPVGPGISKPDRSSPASYAGQPSQAMPFSLPNGTSSQPIFDRPTPPASSSVQAQPPTDHRPSFPAKNPPPTTRLSAAAPPFSLNPSYATLPRSSQPAQEPVASGLASTAPTPAPMFQRPVFAAPAPVFEAPATAPAAPQSLPTAPRSAPTSDTPVFTAPASVPEAPIPAYDAPRSVTPGPTSVSLASTGIHEAPRSSTVTPAPLSVAPPATPVAPSEAIRSPASHVSEEFTDDDMSSTAEEIGAQPISNAGKIKKLRKRISSKLKGMGKN